MTPTATRISKRTAIDHHVLMLTWRQFHPRIMCCDLRCILGTDLGLAVFQRYIVSVGKGWGTLSLLVSTQSQKTTASNPTRYLNS